MQLTSSAPLALTPLLKPESVAVVGASRRMNRASRVVANLQRFAYGGQVFPINPKYDEVLGLKAYPSLAATPRPADTAVVAIPAERVPAVLEQAADAGVRGAIVLSSGFAEAGPAGRERQAALERLGRSAGCSSAGRIASASSTSGCALPPSAAKCRSRCSRATSP